MGFVAVDALDKAIQRTKDLITPVSFRDWTKLAVLMIFLGGSGASSIVFNIPQIFLGSFEGASYDSGGSLSGSGFESTLFNVQSSSIGPSLASPEIGFAVVSGILLTLFGFILLSIYLNCLSQFTLFNIVGSKRIELIKWLKNNYKSAFAYLLFKMGLALFSLILVGVWGLVLLNNIAVGLLLSLVFLPALVLILIISGLVHDFAVPKTIYSRKGFLSSSLEVLKQVRAEWREIIVYLLIRLMVVWAIGLISGTIVIVTSIAFLIVFGLLALLFYMLANVLMFVPILVGVILFLISVLYITVPFKVFMFSYFTEVYEEIFNG